MKTITLRLQTTQATIGGAVTEVINCCANCVETIRPQQWRSNLQFLGKPAIRTRYMAGATPKKAGAVETNPSPTTTHKQVWICGICHKEIHGRKQIYISCNRIEHRVHLRYAGIRQAHFTDS